MTAYFFLRQKSFRNLTEGKCLSKFYSIFFLIIQLVLFLLGLRTYQHHLAIIRQSPKGFICRGRNLIRALSLTVFMLYQVLLGESKDVRLTLRLTQATSEMKRKSKIIWWRVCRTKKIYGAVNGTNTEFVWECKWPHTP
jgi:hypothetical protein